MIVRNSLKKHLITISCSDFEKCHILHVIQAWNNMLVIKTKIYSVDKLMFILISSRLPFTIYTWTFNPFVEVVASSTYYSLKLHSLWEV